MLYTRSSFLKYLTDKRDCQIKPLNQGRNTVILIQHGPVSAYIHLNNKDLIDYEEIYIVCKKLFLDLPGDSDLVRIE